MKNNYFLLIITALVVLIFGLVGIPHYKTNTITTNRTYSYTLYKELDNCEKSSVSAAIIQDFGDTLNTTDRKQPVILRGESPALVAFSYRLGNAFIEGTEGISYTEDCPSVLEITAISQAGLPPLDAGMVNVTGEQAGFRMLPHGKVFTHNINVVLPYDETLLPMGFTPEDIRTYYYNEQYEKWMEIERDSVSCSKQLVYSKVNHFTDFINAVINVPEMPEVSAYTPTSIKELKAANPLEGLQLMQPPTANNSGTANLSYPLEIPAGRQGMQPNLMLTYNSDRGNGWLGVGWDISIPSITVETRWGVPRYDSQKESEVYVLDGEQLATKSDGEKYDPLGFRAPWVSRTNGAKRFYPRVERNFDMIIRHGNSPSQYWWEVKNKEGVIYYYGKQDTVDQMNPNAVLRDNNGNIAKWCLTEIRDLNGNYVRYHYEKFYMDQSNLGGKNIYIKEISYTNHDSLSSHNTIEFSTKYKIYGDITSDCRFGLQEISAKLLDTIRVYNEYHEKKVVSKEYVFCYRQGGFGKTLLSKIGERDGDSRKNAVVITHEFDYYSRSDAGAIFGDEDTINTGNDKEAAYSIIPFKIKASSIGGTSSNSWNVGGALTVGFGANPTQKSMSAGGNYSHEETTSEGVLTLIDLDGNGLPDKIYKKQKDRKHLFYRKQLYGTNGYYFSDEDSIKGVNNFLSEKSVSDNFGVEGHLSFYGIGGSAAYSHGKTSSSNSTYFSDVDGDGLPDIVCNGLVYFNRINDASIHDFVLNTTSTVWVGGSCDSSYVYQDEPVNENMFIPGDTVITTYYERVDTTDSIGKPYCTYIEHHDTTFVQAVSEGLPELDAVKVWIAPYTGVVNIKGTACLTQDLQTARFASRVMDGVKISIQQDDGMGSHVFASKIVLPDTNYEDNSCFIPNLTEIKVTKGDRFYFRLESRDKRLYDKVVWSPNIEYTVVNNRTVDASLSDADGLSIYGFNASNDFLINPKRKYCISMEGISTIKIISDFTIHQGLSDDVVLQVYHNGNAVIGPITINKNTIVNHRPDSIEITVNQGDSVWLSLSSPTNVRWNAVEWNAEYYYTHVSDTSIQVWDTYTDSTQSLPAIVIDNLVPQLTTYPQPILPTNVFSSTASTKLTNEVLQVIGNINAFTALLSIKNNNGVYYQEPLYVNAHGKAVISGQCTLQPNMTYYLDLYYMNSDVQMVKAAYLVKKPEITFGLHCAQPENNLIFGDLYQNWGQFSYRKDNSSETKIIESRLRISDEAQTPPDSTQTLNPNNPENFGTELSNAVYDPLNDYFLMTTPDYKAKRWVGYGNLVYFSADTMSNTFSCGSPTAIDETAFPVPHTQSNNPVTAITKLACTKNNDFNFGASYSVSINNNNPDSLNLSLGYNHHWGKTFSFTDYMDMNGDRFPDVISSEQIQYSKPQGGLSGLTLGHSIMNSSFDSTTFKGNSGSFGSSFTSVKKIPSAKGRSQYELSGAAGINGCAGKNTDDNMVRWIDINGDDLPDRVKKNGQVYYNMGYSYIQGAPWLFCDQMGKSYNIGGGLNPNISFGFIDSAFAQSMNNSSTAFNLFETSIAGGYGFTRNLNRTINTLTDLNGDGLPDRIYEKDDILKVEYNSGFIFGITDTLFNQKANINASLSMLSNLNMAVCFGFTLGICPIKFMINPQGGYTRSMNKVEAQLIDMNGDNLPDYVTSDEIGKLYVRYNQLGKVNLLKTVSNVAGGSMKMDYTLSKSSSDCPQRIMTLSNLSVYDGHTGDGVDTQKFVFSYHSAHYERYERANLGFNTVISKQLNEHNHTYRVVTEKYHNEDYMRKALKYYELISDADGNKFVESFYNYALKEIATGTVIPSATAFCYGEGYPALNEEMVKYYEGDSTAQIVTKKQYMHGPFGNVTGFYDYGNCATGITNDDIFVHISYYKDTNSLNLTGLPETLSITDIHGDTLRNRECTVNAIGQITQIKQINNGSRAVFDYQYDCFGNIVSVTLPENYQHQRIHNTYTYDPVLHCYPVRIDNLSLGYYSTTVYNYRFGKPLAAIDMNGDTLKYEYDNRGRCTKITAPGESGYTLSFSYWLNTENGLSVDTIPWSVTQQYDPQHPDNPLTVVLFSDAVGRTVQVKKDIEVNGMEQRSVSGKVIYDAFGRGTMEYYPVTENITVNPSLFNPRVSTVTPTCHTFDILDRPTKTIVPTGDSTLISYGFSGHNFQTILTDALQNVFLTNKNARGLEVQTIAPGNTATSFVYNALGELISSTDPDNLTTTYSYNRLGQCVSRIHPDAGTDTYTYDLAGNLTAHRTQKLNNSGDSILYHYNYTQLTAIDYPENPENNVHYTYGNMGSPYHRAGRVATQEDASGCQTFFYGNLGEITKTIRTFVLPNETKSYTFTMSYEYDFLNRIQSMTYPDGETVSYDYNLGGMLHRVTGLKGGQSFVYVDSIAYNTYEQKTYMKYGNGTQTRYTYDILMRPDSLKSFTASNYDMQKIKYSYDKVGNIIAVDNRAGCVGPMSADRLGGSYSCTYRYDSLYRLRYSSLGYSANDGIFYRQQATDYTANGRLQRKAMGTSRPSLGTMSRGGYDYRYQYTGAQPNTVSALTNAAGTVLERFTWDANGNMATDVNTATFGTRRLCHDEENRLTGVSDHDYLSYYQYDASGERTYKTTMAYQTQTINGSTVLNKVITYPTLYVSPYLVATEKGYTKHYYAGSERIACRIGGGGLAQIDSSLLSAADFSAKQSANRKQMQRVEDSLQTSGLVNGTRLNILNTLKTGSSNAEPLAYWYHTDHLGSTSWVTDTGGNAVQHLHYLPFGETFINQKTTTFAARYTFSGKEKDVETGYGYFGARYYSSDLSIWISVDPMADKYPSWSNYVYCRNNPIILFDPNGMWDGDFFDRYGQYIGTDGFDDGNVYIVDKICWNIFFDIQKNMYESGTGILSITLLALYCNAQKPSNCNLSDEAIFNIVNHYNNSGTHATMNVSPTEQGALLTTQTIFYDINGDNMCDNYGQNLLINVKEWQKNKFFLNNYFDIINSLDHENGHRLLVAKLKCEYLNLQDSERETYAIDFQQSCSNYSKTSQLFKESVENYKKHVNSKK